MNWSIVIFCYNEAGTLADVVKKCLYFLEGHAAQFEIVIVNDGSTDNTAVICGQLIKTTPGLRVVEHKVNRGIGGALKTGYKEARYDYVCAVPGDGQFDVEELRQVKSFGNNTFYSFYREKIDYNLYRKSLTWLNLLFNRLILGISMRDVNWIKVYRKEQLDFADIQLSSSIIESEISAKLLKSGCTTIQLPSVYQARKFGAPKGGSWRTLRKVIGEIWTLYITVAKFKGNLVLLHKSSVEQSADKVVLSSD